MHTTWVHVICVHLCVCVCLPKAYAMHIFGLFVCLFSILSCLCIPIVTSPRKKYTLCFMSLFSVVVNKSMVIWYATIRCNQNPTNINYLHRFQIILFRTREWCLMTHIHAHKHASFVWWMEKYNYLNAIAIYRIKCYSSDSDYCDVNWFDRDTVIPCHAMQSKSMISSSWPKWLKLFV